MNQSPIKQQSNSLTPQTAELATPHFDDSAIARAHRVEPLPARSVNRFGSSRQLMTIASAAVIAILLGITAAVNSSPARPDDAAPPAFAAASAQDSPDKPANQTEPAKSLVARESAVVRQKSQPRPRRVHALRTIGAYMAEEFRDNDDDARPVARKVGVIHYGRARGEQ